MDTQYLRSNVAQCLTDTLAELALARPADPIAFLAQAMLKWKEDRDPAPDKNKAALFAGKSVSQEAEATPPSDATDVSGESRQNALEVKDEIKGEEVNEEIKDVKDKDDDIVEADVEVSDPHVSDVAEVIEDQNTNLSAEAESTDGVTLYATAESGDIDVEELSEAVAASPPVSADAMETEPTMEAGEASTSDIDAVDDASPSRADITTADMIADSSIGEQDMTEDYIEPKVETTQSEAETTASLLPDAVDAAAPSSIDALPQDTPSTPPAEDVQSSHPELDANTDDAADPSSTHAVIEDTPPVIAQTEEDNLSSEDVGVSAPETDLKAQEVSDGVLDMGSEMAAPEETETSLPTKDVDTPSESSQEQTSIHSTEDAAMKDNLIINNNNNTADVGDSMDASA